GAFRPGARSDGAVDAVGVLRRRDRWGDLWGERSGDRPTGAVDAPGPGARPRRTARVPRPGDRADRTVPAVVRSGPVAAAHGLGAAPPRPAAPPSRGGGTGAVAGAGRAAWHRRAVGRAPRHAVRAAGGQDRGHLRRGRARTARTAARRLPDQCHGRAG